jgi:hypothetical protein
MSGAIIEVVAPDTSEDTRWALGLDNPDAGILAIIAPPQTSTLGQLLSACLVPMGKALEARAQIQPQDQTILEALAWFRAHLIRELVIAHADWMGPEVAGGLAGFAALAGVDVFVLTRSLPEDSYGSHFEAWRSAEVGWVDFAVAEAQALDRRKAMAADPRRNQRDRLPCFETRMATVPVPVTPVSDPLFLLSYGQVHGAMTRAATTGPAAAQVAVRALKPYDGSAGFVLAVRGAAAALAEAGFSLRANPARLRVAAGDRDGDIEGSPWRALRIAMSPHGPAACALLAMGLDTRGIEAVTIEDVAPTGEWVLIGDEPIEVPRGAHVYLRAQRILRLGETSDRSAQFIALRGTPLGRTTIASAIKATLASVGIAVERRDLDGSVRPTERWLFEHGLAITSTAPTIAEGGPGRCRHGLPPTFNGRVSLSHSRRLCRAQALEDIVTPAARTTAVEDRGRAGMYQVLCDGVTTRLLFGVDGPTGRVWIESGIEPEPTCADLSLYLDGRG